MALQNPLTDVHLECCNRVLQDTPDTMDLAKAMQECGHDCSEAIETIKAQDDYARGVKGKFFKYTP
jgi:hypothetical protein